MAVKPIPDRFHTLTPYLRVRGADKAIDFYKKAFGAEEICRMPAPDGSIMHAELKIGDSILMLSNEFPDWGCLGPESLKGTSVVIHIYVEDVDAAVAKAVSAGAKVTMPVQDMFWGDRFGQIADPFGHLWSVATHKEDLTPEQMEQRGKKAMAEMCPPKK